MEKLPPKKQIENDLRHSKARIEALLNAMPEMMFVLTREGIFTDFKAEAGDPLAIPPSEIIGKKLQDAGFSDDAATTVLEVIEKTLNTGEIHSFEYELEFPAGVNSFEARFAPFETDQVLATVRNITDRKQAVEDKLEFERQIQHAQKLESLGVLAGGIAHDFNNLLMAILGNTELALEDLPPHMSPIREHLKDIERVTKRAADLAKQMLAYSGKGRFEIEPIDAEELIVEMAHLLKVSISKTATLNFNFPESVPSFEGDVTQIRQIIMNLITNASEAIGENTGVISLSTGSMHCDQQYLNAVIDGKYLNTGELLEEGIYTFLEVSDTGHGMDSKTVSQIFDPFFTTKFTGRGLGMSAVLGIVRGHKGAISVYSELDKGTTFKVLFPASESHIEIEASDSSTENVSTLWHGTGTILLADDEPPVLSVATQILQRMGFDVLVAVNGQDAVQKFQEHSHEIVCVLLDMTMPKMNGEQAFREMREHQPDVKVILTSGFNQQNITQSFKGKGLAGFIQKPYRIAVLQAKLQELLNGKP